jgi:serine O-acetyltransferase
MKLSLPSEQLHSYLKSLLSNYLPDKAISLTHPDVYFDLALQRVEKCFSNIKKKYYFENGSVVFDHLNCDHMATLLYFYSNTLWRETGEDKLAKRLFYLNKVMHGLDLFYSVKMPDIFLLVHPIGTVLGRAEYSNYFVVYQNCTVGATTTVYPKLGQGTVLYSKSSVIGDCALGNNVVIAANALLINTIVPENTVVTGSYPSHRFTKNLSAVQSRFFE